MKPKTYIILFALCLLMGGAHIPSSYVYEIRFDVAFSHRALIPQTLNYADISLTDKGKLDAVHQQKTIAYKVKPDFGLDVEVQYASRDDELEWMRLPYRLEMNETHRLSYDRQGKLLRKEPLSDAAQKRYTSRKMYMQRFGLGVALEDFPLPSGQSIQALLESGAQVVEPRPGVLQLNWPNGGSVQYDLKNLSISRCFKSEAAQLEVYERITYAFFPEKGFLPIEKETKSHRPDGIVMVDQECFGNYRISGRLPDLKRELKGLDVFPNPAQDELNLRLSNPLDRLLEIELYALDGQKLRSFAGDGRSRQQLDLGSLKSGTYILEVKSYLDHYTTLIFKT
jgi:hypothetical protein